MFDGWSGMAVGMQTSLTRFFGGLALMALGTAIVYGCNCVPRWAFLGSMRTANY